VTRTGLRVMSRCAALVSCGWLAAGQASAQITLYEISEQDLESALVEFANKARLSIDFTGLKLAGIQTKGSGKHVSKEASLRALLAGTGFGFRFIDASTVQIFKPIVKKNTPDSNGRNAIEGIRSTSRMDRIEELVVTAAKRPTTSFQLPVSVTGVSALALEDLGAYDFQALAPHLAGVSTTNLGPGRNKIFVRGLSDGPYANRTQSVVGVYIDETPINSNDTNPDIRLFDVERVELVRGPQGSLYGAGSLGGLYRVITKKPDLDETNGKARIALSDTYGGGVNGVLDFAFNMPVVKDELGLRLTGYATVKGGYIDDVLQGVQDTNHLKIYGVHPALRWKVSEAWTVDAVLNYQSIRYDDSQYFFKELGRNNRGTLLPEPYNDDFVHISMTLRGQIGSVDLTSASAYIDRTIKATSDASAGNSFIDDIKSADEALFFQRDLSIFGDTDGLKIFSHDEAAAYFARDDINTFIHETRVKSDSGGRLEWLAGAFYLRRKQIMNSALALSPADKISNVALAETRAETVNDFAVFGEAVYHFNDKFSVTGGLRYLHSKLTLDYNSHFIFDAGSEAIQRSKRTSRFIPKAAARYQWSEDIQTYLQVSMGYRVGGININTPLDAFTAAEPSEDAAHISSTEFESDTLTNIEGGLKSYWFDKRLSLNLAIFFVRWIDIQSDQLGPSGLPFVTNVGGATSRGYEAEVSANLLPGLELRGSFFWNESALQKDNAFLGARAGDRLPTIPENTASIALLYEIAVSQNWKTTISGDYAYIGRSALTFDEENSPKMGAYGILNARLQFSNDIWKVGLFAQNLGDSYANTFSFGNSFTVSRGNQVTPPRPRTFGVFLERKF